MRSYHGGGDRTPNKILQQACKEGNLPAVIKGLKLYPELRTKKLYRACWNEAANNAHPEIAWFFFDLLKDSGGATDRDYPCLELEAAVRSLDVELLKEFLRLTKEGSEGWRFWICQHLVSALMEAFRVDRPDMVKALDDYRNFRSFLYMEEHVDLVQETAGRSGRYENVEFVYNALYIERMSKSMKQDFFSLVRRGALKGNHLDLIARIDAENPLER